MMSCDLVLSSHFLILKLFGMWLADCNNGISYCLYYVWRAYILIHTTIFFISQSIDLCTQKDVKGMTANFATSTVVFCSILKMGVLLLKRREILNMMDLLKLPICQPTFFEEHEILKIYKRRAWSPTAVYLLFSFCTVVLQFVSPFVNNNGIEERILPYNTWQPYGIESTLAYVLTYIFLFTAALLAMPLTIGIDSLISGFMVVACSQMEILKFRVTHIHTYADVKDCVQHHNIILQYGIIGIKFVERIGDIFGMVVFVQFLLSMINICSVIFVISKSESKAGCVTSSLFLFCMMFELLLYCWNGNEVFLQSKSVSQAAMNNLHWLTSSSQNKKALLLIMARAQSPVRMKAGWLLTLSLDTFMMILKSSYSAFNLLQRSTHD